MSLISLDDILTASADDTIYDSVVKRNLQKRVLILNQDVDNSLIETFCLFIFQWNEEDKDIPVDKRQHIKVYLDSCGGDVIIGNFIIEAITQSKTPVDVVGMSLCASMASYILVSGHTRYAFPSTTILLHDGSTYIQNSSNKVRDVQKYYDALDERQRNFMLSHTKMSSEFMDKIADREYYMFADEAKELGIIDKIIGVDCDLEEIL